MTMPISRDNLTLTAFFERVYRRYVLVGGAPRTITIYREDMTYWKRLTGDPPLSTLDGQAGQELVLKFRADFLALPKRNGESRSPHSVNKTMRTIRALLLKAGPRGPHNPEGFDLLAQPPHIRMLKAQKRYFKRLSLAELNALYEAIPRVVYLPRIENVEPVDWWQAFLVLAYGTGLRLGAILNARVDDVDWQEKTLMIRGDKTGDERPKALRPEVVWHLRRVVGAHGLLFPWPHVHGRKTGHRVSGSHGQGIEGVCFGTDFATCYTNFHGVLTRQWKRIVHAAGIPRNVRIHDLRKTSASMIAGSQVRAMSMAGRVLDHSGMQVTSDHYIDHLELEREAVACMPWPESMRIPMSASQAVMEKPKPEAVIDRRLAEAVKVLARELRRQPKASGVPNGPGVFSRFATWTASMFQGGDLIEPDVVEPALDDLQEAIDAAASGIEERRLTLDNCTERERLVLERIGTSPVSGEAILRATALEPGEVMATLTGLQLKRLVRRHTGNCWVKLEGGAA